MVLNIFLALLCISGRRIFKISLIFVDTTIFSCHSFPCMKNESSYTNKTRLTIKNNPYLALSNVYNRSGRVDSIQNEAKPHLPSFILCFSFPPVDPLHFPNISIQTVINTMGNNISENNIHFISYTHFGHLNI